MPAFAAGSLMRRGTPHLSIRLKDSGGRRHRWECRFSFPRCAPMSNTTLQRKRALAARRALSPAQRSQHSRRACRRIVRLGVMRRAHRIGLYWPLRSEADPRSLLSLLPGRTQFFLPRVSDGRLRFVPFATRGLRLRRSRLGVYEPRGGRAVSVDTLDVLILPLAAFDARARRIGMGGGYYDRTLATHARLRRYRSPALVGLGFEAQRVAMIATRSWDVDLDWVVSEAGCYSRRVGLG